MPHVIRWSVLLALFLPGVATCATLRANGVPSPSNSTIPSCIRLVGSNGSVPATTFGQFEVIFRDLANNPIANAWIVVDFSATPELALAADQLDPDVLLDCAAQTVRKRTDGNGRAVFCVVGRNRIGEPPTTWQDGGRIFADGIYLGASTVNAFDLDGQQGVGAGDLAQFLSDFASGFPYGRSNFDCNGSIGAGDLVIWLTAFSSGSQIVSAPTVCP